MSSTFFTDDRYSTVYASDWGKYEKQNAEWEASQQLRHQRIVFIKDNLSRLGYDAIRDIASMVEAAVKPRA